MLRFEAWRAGLPLPVIFAGYLVWVAIWGLGFGALVGFSLLGDGTAVPLWSLCVVAVAAAVGQTIRQHSNRRMVGGRVHLRELLTSIRTGELPAAFDRGVWRIELLQRERSARQDRWLSPLIGALLVGALVSTIFWMQAWAPGIIVASAAMVTVVVVGAVDASGRLVATRALLDALQPGRIRATT